MINAIKQTAKETLIMKSGALIRRGFVSASKPSQQAVKIDKETCGKVIEAAETVKDGTKEVVGEVKRITQTVTEKVTNVAGNMITEMADKGIEKASQTAETKRGKDVLDTAKAVTEAYKERVKHN